MRVKHFLGITLAVLLALPGLSACGAGASGTAGGTGAAGGAVGGAGAADAAPAAETPVGAEPAGETPAETPPLAYIFNGTPVTLGADAAEIIAAIGEPEDTFEAESCAFAGMDKILYYPGFYINTYPSEGRDYILSVVLTGDSQTPEGVYLGMPKARAAEVFAGALTETGQRLEYTVGDTRLILLAQGDLIADITYYFTAAGGQAD
ncbi:MAG: hypothetical protein LBK56_03855 [Gracilibacteraceae bacterium]|jgi:hypothetical protein|nr:hypothetical protein [Gracilibacteraceae bacterium]